MKLCLAPLWILLLASIAASAATTTVTATVADPNSQAFANGTFKAEWYGDSQAVVTGVGPFNKGPISGTTDGTGTFSVVLTDDHTVAPIGGKWRFTICGDVTSPCFSSIQDVFGVTQNLSASISNDANAISVFGSSIPKAYSTTEISNPKKGVWFFDTTALIPKVYDGTTWTTMGGGGGGGGAGLSGLTTNTVMKAGSPTTAVDSGMIDTGSLATETEPFALGSTLNSAIPMLSGTCPTSGTAGTVTWCVDAGSLPAIEEGPGPKQYLSIQPNLPNEGTTGTVLNGSAKVNATGNAISCGITDTIVPCYPVNSNTATTGQAQLITSGNANALFDATAVTAADCVINSTTVANKFHDAGPTCPVGTWIVGRAASSGLASTTQTVLVNSYFNSAGGGGGTVTSFSSGDLAPLFTVNVGTPTTTPAQTFNLSNAGAGTVFGNSTGTPAVPTYFIPTCALLSNSAPSCSIDATNANNIATGSVALARLAAPINGIGSVRTVSGTTDTLLAADCFANVTYTSATAVAVTVPQATGSFAAPCPIHIRVTGAGVATLTPTTSTIDALTSIGMNQFTDVTIYSDSTNWLTQGESISVKNAALSVNTLQVQPSIAAAAVTLAAIGSDTNIGVIFKSKGTGTLTFQPGSNSAACVTFANATNTGLFRIDCTNGFVGVGSAAPLQTFDIKNKTQWNANGLQVLDNNITTVGNGHPIDIYNTAQTTQRASVATQNIASPGADTMYEVGFNVSQLDIGAGCTGGAGGNVGVNIIYTDAVTGTSYTIVVPIESSAGTALLANLPLSGGTPAIGVANVGWSGPVRIRVKTGTNTLQYSTTYTNGTGCTTQPGYNIYPIVRVAS